MEEKLVYLSRLVKLYFSPLLYFFLSSARAPQLLVVHGINGDE